MQKYNFACGSVWVWDLATDIKGGTQTEGENRVLRGVFGMKRGEVTGGWVEWLMKEY
jgi:hypothetical protein